MRKHYYFIVNFYIAIITSLFFIACTKESDLLDKGVASQKTVQKIDKVGEAIDFINDVFISHDLTNSAPGSTATPKVSISKSTIDTIYDLPDKNKKPFLQLVVFKPKAYALISVIKKVKNPPVLFYSKDKFDIKKPSIGLIKYLKDFLANSVKPKVSMGRFTVSEYRIGYRTTIIEQVAPLLQTEWHQDSPFNKTIISKKGIDHLLVGCVAIATGQMMAYYRKNNLKYYNWDKILSGYQNYSSTADFLWDIAEGVNMNYGTPSQGGSGTQNIEAVKYFRSAGYTVNLINCQYSIIFNELKQKRPVYLSAFAKKFYNTWFWSIFGIPYITYGDGHAWVTDGYRIVTDSNIFRIDKVDPRTGRVLDTTTYSISRTTTYLHMNWGWFDSNSWCTYNYWKEGRDNFQYDKKIMTVKP